MELWTPLQSRWQHFLRLDKYFTWGKSVSGTEKGTLPDSLGQDEHSTSENGHITLITLCSHTESLNKVLKVIVAN